MRPKSCTEKREISHAGTLISISGTHCGTEELDAALGIVFQKSEANGGSIGQLFARKWSISSWHCQSHPADETSHMDS